MAAKIWPRGPLNGTEITPGGPPKLQKKGVRKAFSAHLGRSWAFVWAFLGASWGLVWPPRASWDRWRALPGGRENPGRAKHAKTEGFCLQLLGPAEQAGDPRIRLN